MQGILALLLVSFAVGGKLGIEYGILAVGVILLIDYWLIEFRNKS